jgi:hypothetical protein
LDGVHPLRRRHVARYRAADSHRYAAAANERRGETLVVRDVHERELTASAEEVGKLVDDPKRMWPHGRWPELRPDGIGFLRHEPLEHDRGRARRYRITGPDGFTGWHGWEVTPAGLRHVVEAECRGWSRVAWPIVIRPIHDALHEDVLDRAEAALGGTPHPRHWSRWVRFLRWMLRRR